jgi:hypothetical protein
MMKQNLMAMMESIDLELSDFESALDEGGVVTDTVLAEWLRYLTEIDQTITKIQEKIRPVLEILNDFPPDQTQTTEEN